MSRISKLLLLPCLLALLALASNVDASRIRTIVEVDGVQFVTWDNGGTPTPPTTTPPVVVTPPATTPSGTSLPAGAQLVPWTNAAQENAVVGSVAVHVPVPANAVGELRAFIQLSSSAAVDPSGSIYNGVHPQTVGGGGVVAWHVRIGAAPGPGEDQGFQGQDFVLNVIQPDGQQVWFQFQWYPA